MGEDRHVFGPYRVLGKLGEGGMGVVYRAVHGTTGEPVAIKTVGAQRGSPSEGHLASIRRELRTLQRIEHPGVIQIRGSGVVDGRPWYAMELIEGATLKDHIREVWLSAQTDVDTVVGTNGPQSDWGVTHTHASQPWAGQEAFDPTGGPAAELAIDPAAADTEKWLPAVPPADNPPREATRPPVAAGELHAALTVMRRLFESLAFLHGEGVIHQDVKPSNVLLRSGLSPVLFDFGLARRWSGPSGREALEALLTPGGTPAYMAPEQIRGQLLDARCDLYSAGCVLYALLTGQPPFTGSEKDEVLRKHLGAAVIPPSHLVRDIPPALDTLVLRLLQKWPRERIGYATDAIAVLDALGAEPTHTDRKARFYVYRPALAGREQARSRLGEAAERADGGQGGCTLIVGESGIGKTYLAIAAARSAVSSEFRIITGTCVAVGVGATGAAKSGVGDTGVGDTGVGDTGAGAPLHPFTPFLQAVADRCMAAGPSVTAQLLGANGRILASVEPYLTAVPGFYQLPAAPALSGLAARERLLGALADTLAAFTEARPLVLLLDDLQWADELSVSFLTSLPEDFFAGRRLLIIGTHRSEQARDQLAALSARPYTRVIELERLPGRVIGALVSDMLAVTRPDPELVEFLVKASAGNPFFVAEYIRAATAHGLIERTADGRLLSARGTLDSLQLPQTLGELVAYRLQWLSQKARTLVELASVAGRTFAQEPVLRALAALGMEESAALDGLAELVAHQVLESSQGGGMSFAHDKLREIVYRDLSRERRALLHGLVAEALIGYEPDALDNGSLCAVLGHHLAIAGDPARAIEFTARAAEHAFAAAAYRRAADLLSRTIRMDRKARARGQTGAARSRVAHWHRRAGEALFNLGELEAAARQCTDALDALGIVIGSDNRARRLLTRVVTQARLQLGIGGPRRPAPEDRGRLIDAALAAGTMAWRYAFTDDNLGVASMALLSANSIEGVQPPIRLSAPYAWLGSISGTVRLHALARFYFERARENARARARGDNDHQDHDDDDDDILGASFTDFMEAVYQTTYGNWPRVEHITSRAIAALREAGAPQDLENNLTALGNAYYYSGRFAESMACFEDILARARARDNRQHAAWGLFSGAFGLLAIGRHDVALTRLREAEELLADQGDTASKIICYGLLSLAYLRVEDFALARYWADRTTHLISESGGVVYSTIAGRASVCEVYLELLARAHAQGLDELSALRVRAQRSCQSLRLFALAFPFAGPAADRYRGQLAFLTGKRARGRRLLGASIAAARKYAMPYDQLRAHVLMVRHGRPSAAWQSLHEAEKLGQELGCEHHLQVLADLRASRTHWR